MARGSVGEVSGTSYLVANGGRCRSEVEVEVCVWEGGEEVLGSERPVVFIHSGYS